MLVIDLPSWRAFDIAGQVQVLSDRGILSRLYYDQDLLNLCLSGRWLEINRLWNVTLPHDAHQVLGPHILHFTGSHKPWQLFSKAGYARLYRHVMTNEIFYRYLRQRILHTMLWPFKQRQKARDIPHRA